MSIHCTYKVCTYLTSYSTADITDSNNNIINGLPSPSEGDSLIGHNGEDSNFIQCTGGYFPNSEQLFCSFHFALHS